MNEETIKLGGNIELSGFHEMDGSIMIVLKKIIGNHAKRMTEKTTNFEKLSIHMKKVHEKEASKLYELHAKLLDNGKLLTSEATERNVFVAVDSALKGVFAQLK